MSLDVHGQLLTSYTGESNGNQTEDSRDQGFSLAITYLYM